MSKNNCLFRARWLKDERFKHWIRRENDTVAICNYCSKNVSVTDMDETALISYIEGKKHV